MVDQVTRRSDFDRLKTPAPAATVQRFKNHVAHRRALREQLVEVRVEHG
ncbi:hypothetical protein SAMN04489716_2060 [Actinoplanes derwentensis]|uniref:Uncharacterized protein n=1 Tax=Actinoplanes derwentensis TaxID=113562 RepID=A0A1H1WCA0_9ACTN|nr:hypothetical protein SAMN04489716_2060 [Actinoplanes derwentensis]